MADFWDQALGVLGAVAPTVATAFGGPLAGQAVRWVEGALGIPQTGDKDAMAQAIVGATPDQLLALKKCDNDFKAHLADLGVDLERIAAGDRDSARKMQIETKDWTPRILALLLTIGFFGVLLWMLKYGLTKDSGGEALLVMLGALGTAFGAVVNFFFGSSAGSAKKDDTIKALAQ